MARALSLASSSSCRQLEYTSPAAIGSCADSSSTMSSLSSSTPSKRPFSEDAESRESPSLLTTHNDHAAAVVIDLKRPDEAAVPKTQDSFAPALGGSVSGSLGFPTLSATEAFDSSKQRGDGSAEPALKRRRLTFAEKQEVEKIKAAEKDAREKQRAVERARREEEKRVREEDRRKREEERKRREQEKEERMKKREAERQAKEDEKRKKEEEKAKHERAQLRLNSFFKSEPSSSIRSQSSRGNSGQPEEIQDLPNTKTTDTSNSDGQDGTRVLSDYEKAFAPFFLKSHTSLAPINRFSRDQDALKRFDDAIHHPSEVSNKSNIQELLHILPQKCTRRGRTHPPVKDLIEKLQGSSDYPVDLTNDRSPSSQGILSALEAIPVKYLEFCEDVRPPYQGTFTRPVSARLTRRLSKKPFERALPGINYDYDSEAEWEDPGEGDDINSETDDDSVEDDDDEDDLAAFLDDDDGPATGKKRVVVGDLKPWCSGLLWENSRGSLVAPDSCEGSAFNPETYRTEIIMTDAPTSIDPYSTSYWKTSSATTSDQGNNAMAPPRSLATSTEISDASATQSPSGQLVLDQFRKFHLPVVNVAVQPQKSQKQTKRILPPEFLPAFKEAVSGSNLTKAGLVEVLKKQFPKVPKDIIKDTLSAIAERVGTKEANKRWMLLEFNQNTAIS